MNRSKLFLTTLLVTVLTFQINAQNAKKAEAKTVKTVYYYQFEGAKSLNEVSALSKDVYALKGVTEFKPVFKAEKNMAQIIVVVTEKTRTSESDILFNVSDLKKVLEKKGYKNLEYISEELPVN